MKENNLCYHPWVGLDISPQGEFKPCCKYSEIIANSLDEYLTSDKLKELKESFLQGQRPAGCHRCWADENAGHVSKRLEDWQYIFNSSAPDLTKYKSLSISFGNSCNLACRTCTSYSSSTWFVEAKKLLAFDPDIKLYKHHRFYQDKTIVDKLKSISTDLTDLYIAGGEPFLPGNDESLDFLNFLIEHNANNLKLHYVSNATSFPEQGHWDRWKHFKKVEIQISLDGIDKQFEYTRWPASWAAVKDNIDKYKNVDVDNFKLSVSHVVSVFTVYYLPEFYKWALQNQFDAPFFSLLEFPTIYDIRNIPKNIKDKIAEKLSRFKFDNIISYMYSDSFDEFDRTIEYIRTLDQQRQQTFSSTYPEFNQLLQEAGCQI